uniref:Uncharacterized protein n=1 Tax=Cacopsylla melanoneura TaxID=428564 RepID=A0A8D9BBE8_9HEMI
MVHPRVTIPQTQAFSMLTIRLVSRGTSYAPLGYRRPISPPRKLSSTPNKRKPPTLLVWNATAPVPLLLLLKDTLRTGGDLGKLNRLAITMNTTSIPVLNGILSLQF